MSAPTEPYNAMSEDGDNSVSIQMNDVGTPEESEEKKELTLNTKQVGSTKVESISGMMLDGICPGAPECVTLGHQWHISEIGFALIFAICLICLFIKVNSGEGGSINSQFFGALGTVGCVGSFVVFWNYHDQITLAKLAGVFEAISKEFAKQVLAAKEANDEQQKQVGVLGAQNDTMGVEMERLHESLGIMDKAGEELKNALADIDAVVNAQRKMTKFQGDMNSANFRKLRQAEYFRLKNEVLHTLSNLRADCGMQLNLERQSFVDTNDKKRVKALIGVLKAVGVDYKSNASRFDSSGDGKIKIWEMMEGTEMILQERVDKKMEDYDAKNRSKWEKEEQEEKKVLV